MSKRKKAKSATTIELKWANGYRARVDVTVAQTEVEKLRDEQGRILPESVVEAAKAKGHPLHSVFDWDNSMAAHEWRLEQARRMIRSIHVVRIETPSGPTRSFSLERVSKVERSDGTEQSYQAYRSTEEMMAIPALRQQLIHRALGELLAVRRKYMALQELAVVFSAIDALAADFHEHGGA